MNCVFCWQLYEHSSGAADYNMLDGVKKVMNVLYHRLHSQFMPSMSYNGLQIRHIFMATIRVYAQNLFYVSCIRFKLIIKTENCLTCFVSVCQSYYNICTKGLMQDLRFPQQCLLRIQIFLDVMLCCWASGSPWFKGSYHHHLQGWDSLESLAQQHSIPSKKTWIPKGLMIMKLCAITDRHITAFSFPTWRSKEVFWGASSCSYSYEV